MNKNGHDSICSTLFLSCCGCDCGSSAACCLLPDFVSFVVVLIEENHVSFCVLYG